MRISISGVITRPAEELFWLSQDYSRRLEWDEYLADAHLLDGHAAAAVGVQSFCKNHCGSVLVSRYITFAPPTHAAVEMVKGPWILRSFGGTWRFKALEDGSTEVRFIYNFKTRPAFLGWLLEPIVASFYRRDMRSRLAAFKKWTESRSVEECKTFASPQK